jgi:hypothetical protein
MRQHLNFREHFRPGNARIHGCCRKRELRAAAEVAIRWAEVWDTEVVPLLKSAPGLRPVAIFDEIRRRHPGDRMGTGYATLWNAFKRITAGCSQIEKLALYSGTAKRLYHLD